MQRAFYESPAHDFLNQSDNYVLGVLTRNNPFPLEETQRNAWLEEIRILRQCLGHFGGGHIIFEYTIPRIGNRIDAVYILDGLLFLLEFKVGDKRYTQYGINQVTDYALDLKNFHKVSHNRLLIPMLVATNAPSVSPQLSLMKAEGILDVICCNGSNLADAIRLICSRYRETSLDPKDWIMSAYMPTPTIIEAAQALYCIEVTMYPIFHEMTLVLLI